jgi:hypothetical protein
VVAPGNNVRKEILSASTADGSVLKLVLLADGSCAILRAGELLAQGSGEPTAIEGMIEQLLRMVDGDGSSAGLR